MALNTLKCNHMTPLRFKGLTSLLHGGRGLSDKHMSSAATIVNS